MVQELSLALDFDAEEQEIAHLAEPSRWAGFALSTLSGGEWGAKRYDRVFGPLTKATSFFLGELPRDETILDYNTGNLAMKMDGLYKGSAQEKGHFEQASKILARFFFTIGDYTRFNSGYGLVTTFPQTQLRSTTPGRADIIFNTGTRSELAIPIDGLFHNIVIYGPGLSGGEQYRSLIGNMRRVDFVSGGKAAYFVNALIDVDIQKPKPRRRRPMPSVDLPVDMRLDETAPAPAETRFYVDGIAASVERFDDRYVADAVIMSSVHTAGVKECKAGVKFAAEHLRAGGWLIVKAPDASLGDEGVEAGMDRILPFATDLLGEPAYRGACGTSGQHIDPELPPRRSASFAIFQKG